MSDYVAPMRNILLREQDRKPGKHSTDSNQHVGHEQRMAWHMMQVRNHPCPCGSGARFGDCCLGKRRCKDCGRHFLAPNGKGDGRAVDSQVCPYCGSKRTVAMHLREVCG